MLEGTEGDPGLVKDINLTAYRDVIDYLGMWADGKGSMTSVLESRATNMMLANRAGKIKRVRINYLGAQGGDPSREFVQVGVPKMHPLFSYEGDNPLDLPSWLDMDWETKIYRKKTASDAKQDATKNTMAKLLLLQACGNDLESPWGKVSQYRLKHIAG